MKTKELDSTSTDASLKPIKKDSRIQKKKKKENFEVRIPRIIVRNLNFKVDEDRLKKAFEKSNISVNSVSIVNKDGKSKGFGFITFEKLEDAQKAIQTLNGQKILGRPMALDWSLPKNVYEKMHTKESRPTTVENDSYGIHSDSKSSEIEEEIHDETFENDLEENEEEIEENDDEAEEIEETKTRTTESSRDVREHRTIFLRNVPFDATEDEIKELLLSNGERRVLSCRLVIDPVSKHPRGSAFVQFASAEDAQACLNSSYKLHGQELQIDMALGRNELSQAKELRDKKNDSNKKHDLRNLSLANYGVILDINALDGNEIDLKKRQKLEDIKKQKLKNLLYFISPTRLTIHNLPKTVDDDKLRKLITEMLKKDKVPVKDIILKECRVMKTNKDSKKSLGFGFISVTHNDIAKRIIDLLNNNKHAFGPSRRPIVQFSIENRRALQLKEQRLERIKAKQELLKNPTNKTLSFESNKKKKQQKYQNSFDQQKNTVRLSELVHGEENKNMNDDAEYNNDNDDAMEISEYEMESRNNTKKKAKRPKTKSKAEVRDNLDRLIAKTRNKPKLPERTKKKWFE